MTTVFLSGSRKISRLNEEIRSRLQNILKQNFQIFVGDANGADKAIQSYLAEQCYSNVCIFCAGDVCRNNIGSWETRKIKVDKNLTGREFYTQKDKAMAAKADYGFVLWDGKSKGSIANVFELLRNKKIAVVYFAPRKEFFNIKSADDARRLLNLCETSISYNLQGSQNLRQYMESLNITDQHSLQL